MAQPQTNKKNDTLKTAKLDIIYTASVSEELGGGETWQRFNGLYRDIQQELGESVVDLEKRITVTPVSVSQTQPKKKIGKKKKTAVSAKAAESSSGSSMWIVLVVLLVGAGGGAAVYLKQGKKKKPVAKAKPGAVAVTKKKAPPTKAKM
jgi:hypothetical protein